MAHAHFKDKLLNDLKDTSAPFRCPAPDCSYETRERDKWSRHYGSVHGLIKKYLKQYFEENPKNDPSSISNDTSSEKSSPYRIPNIPTFIESASPDNETSPSIKVTGFTDGQKVKEKYILKVSWQNPNIGTLGCSLIKRIRVFNGIIA